jgi:hypothetical protein
VRTLRTCQGICECIAETEPGGQSILWKGSIGLSGFSKEQVKNTASKCLSGSMAESQGKTSEK